MSDPHTRPSRKTTCRRCDSNLWQAKCDCWVDSLGTRYCPGGTLHDPARSVQPQRCGVPNA
jgi:hypothetical protein